MAQQNKKNSTNKLTDILKLSMIYYLAVELLEELIEEAITFSITSLVIKMLSAFTIVCVSQGVKALIKTFIRSITYKEGNDKVEKLKNFGKYLFANKFTIFGIITSAVTVASGTGVIDISTLPVLEVNGFNVTPVIYYIALGILAIICSFYPETIERYAKRIESVKAEKEEKKAEKEIAKETAKAEKEQAEKLAKAKALVEQRKKEAEEKAKAEAEQAEIEKLARELENQAQ